MKSLGYRNKEMEKNKMIKLENYEVMGWEHAIRGMRNPMNSWEKSDSHICRVSSTDECTNCENLLRQPGDFSWCTQPFIIGPNDLALMKKLRNAGTDHRKFMRMIVAYVDITAPLYWWKEFDTYKVGTVANSCSTMHKLTEKPFEWSDFSFELLMDDPNGENSDTPLIINPADRESALDPANIGALIIHMLNACRLMYLETKERKYWDQMIELLPSSYNQKRTVCASYEVLANMYHARKNHKLTEWRKFCEWIKTLPYSELITGEE